MTTHYEEEILIKADKYRIALVSIPNTPYNDKLQKIIDTVTKSAAKAETDAGYEGAMHDNGASNSVEKLKAFLDGVNFAQTGKSKVYAEVIRIHEMEKDTEYKEYLRLKNKFDTDSFKDCGITKI